MILTILRLLIQNPKSSRSWTKAQSLVFFVCDIKVENWWVNGALTDQRVRKKATTKSIFDVEKSNESVNQISDFIRFFFT